MKSSNLLVAFATMGTLVGGSAAIADEKIAVATPPADAPGQTHQQICQQQKKSLMNEGAALKAEKEARADKGACDISLRYAAHNEHMVSLIKECASDFGMSDLTAGKFILGYTYYADGLRKGCSPQP